MAGKVDHAAAGMPQGDVTQFMGDDGGHFFCGNLVFLVFIVKPAGYENPAIRCRKPVHGFDFIDVDFDAGDIDYVGHLRSEGAQFRVRQFGRFFIQLARRAPCGQTIHKDAVTDGKQDGEEFEHRLDMGPKIGAASHAINRSSG